jgi:hypothetical protein
MPSTQNGGLPFSIVRDSHEIFSQLPSVHVKRLRHLQQEGLQCPGDNRSTYFHKFLLRRSRLHIRNVIEIDIDFVYAAAVQKY